MHAAPAFDRLNHHFDPMGNADGARLSRLDRGAHVALRQVKESCEGRVRLDFGQYPSVGGTQTVGVNLTTTGRKK